jgi:predicted nucleotidyltransferase
MDKLKLLKQAKEVLSKDGFLILGVVGSFARGEEYHDIDIIYETTKEFEEKYLGWNYFIKIDEIKNYLQDILGVKVDLINNSAMNNIAKEYMLKDFVNV